MKRKLQQLATALFIAVCVLLASRSVYTQGTAAATLTAALEKDVITQHEPVIVGLSLNNPTSNQVDFELGYGYENVEVKVIDPDGQVWPKPQPAPREGAVFRQSIQARAGTTGINSLLLDKWFKFEKVGQYHITIAVAPSKNLSSGHMGGKNTSLYLTVLPRDEVSLASACAALVARIETRKSAADAIIAAEALSGVNDPVAVPYLAGALEHNLYSSMMIAALARLNTPEAINVLMKATRSTDPETSALAHNALAALGKAGPPR